MKIETFYPRHAILREHIEYYYFLRTYARDFKTAYYSFPNTLQSFNIHKNASCEIGNNSTHVYGVPEKKYLMIAQGKYESPLQVLLEGKLDKVTINFKPLGLNHFIRRPLAAVTPEHSQSFHEWDQYAETPAFLQAFFHANDNETRVDLLEDYLLRYYQPLDNEALLLKAIHSLMDFSTELPVQEIAESLSVSVRSFNRLFYNNMSITPVSFRKIARFRHSLKNRLFNEQFKNLTDIGYESNFYDQAYFVKMYKKITGSNPGKFFKSVEKLADDHLIFQFLKE
ncbi:helix-turn-helix domain-containing protein [Chitinophaga niabensis]|uniref:helix-turn-helix domain-containing protein n=1 Tax=Chitinophaga niabensis TaxID=536979 RepID=UPI0031BB0B15